MTIIQWLSEAIDEVRVQCRANGREFVPVYRIQRIEWRRRTSFYMGVVACSMIVSGLPMIGWAADRSSPDPLKPRTVVAAGVGYEYAETSTITVKTYDAETGAILSEETYDLNVKEDGESGVNQPRERIFAGGVGPGSDGLSAFTLRAYDAGTGRFLWEGLLNLNVDNHDVDSTHRVVTRLVAPRATVTQVRSRGAIAGQPEFFLRAVDSATGELIWADQFSAGAGRLARTERISRAVVGQTEGVAIAAQQIEFRIRMTNARDRRTVWEDTIEAIGGETDVAVGHDDAAEILPAWHGEGYEEIQMDAI